MRRIRLTEGQLHRIIRHAVNEAVESNEESYMLKGISHSLLSSDEDGIVTGKQIGRAHV